MKAGHKTMFGTVNKDGEYVLNPGSRPAVQSFKDQCDINRILDKAKRAGVVSHISQYGGQYGDFTGFDYESAMVRIAEANSMFYDLPAEVRAEFGNKPSAFLTFVTANPPEVVAEKLPQLAAPGRQFPDVIGGGTPPSGLKAASPAASAASEPPPAAPPAPDPGA